MSTLIARKYTGICGRRVRPLPDLKEQSTTNVRRHAAEPDCVLVRKICKMRSNCAPANCLMFVFLPDLHLSPLLSEELPVLVPALPSPQGAD